MSSGNYDFLKSEKPNLLSFEEIVKNLRDMIDPFTQRFTKHFYQEGKQDDEFDNVVIQFSEPKIKKPVPEHVARLIFTIPKKEKFDVNETKFRIENESLEYRFADTINKEYFPNLIDRVINNKLKAAKTLILTTTFESTRNIQLNGELKKYYTIEDDENIFTNNNSEYFFNESKYSYMDTNKIISLIKLLWKALNTRKDDTITFEEFCYLNKYGNLNFNEVNMQKLWKYTDKENNGRITYPEFLMFAMDLIHTIRAYHVAKDKEDTNTYIENKITNCVEILNQHFKEYDYQENNEISFDNLKKCLSKENELFSRKEIEIITKQINPDKNFEYWKFDKILKILYVNHFNYNQLCKEDKIYNYLIKLFSKVDDLKVGKLHFRKMKAALLHEEKLRLNKTQICIILNFFNINENPEIDYYKASLIIRNIIQELFSGTISVQKVEISNNKNPEYENYEDEYDVHLVKMKDLYVNFDQDFDHLLDRNEFNNFLNWLISYLTKEEKDKLFETVDANKDGKVSYPEFKESFASLVQMTRIRNVMREIAKLFDDK